MNTKFTFFLLLSSFVFFSKGMLEGEFKQEELEENRDIEGCGKFTLPSLGLRLRKKDAQDSFIADYFNNIEIYFIEDEESYIDLHLNKYALVQDFFKQRIMHANNLYEFMENFGFFDCFEGAQIAVLERIFKNCTMNPKTNKFNTNNLLHEIFDLDSDDSDLSDSDDDANDSDSDRFNALQDENRTIYDRLKAKLRDANTPDSRRQVLDQMSDEKIAPKRARANARDARARSREQELDCMRAQDKALNEEFDRIIASRSARLHREHDDIPYDESDTEEVAAKHNRLKQQATQLCAQGQTLRNQWSDIVQRRTHRRSKIKFTSVIEKLCYLGTGFTLALPICYLCYLKFGKS